jgi:hypothetical protein
LQKRAWRGVPSYDHTRYGHPQNQKNDWGVRNVTRQYDWLKPWIERLYIFNTFVADSALGVAVFAAAHFAERGLRNLDVANKGCPDLGNPGLADIIHYVGMAVVVCIIGHFSFSLVRNMIKDET